MTQPENNSDWQPCRPGMISDIIGAREAARRQRMVAIAALLAVVLVIPAAGYLAIRAARSPATPNAFESLDPYVYVDDVDCEKAFRALATFQQDGLSLEEIPENFRRHLERCRHCRDEYEAKLTLQPAQPDRA